MIPDHVKNICNNLRAIGASKVLLVGGCVRDIAMNLKPEDWDIEVYGLDIHSIISGLNTTQKVDLVGQAFGIIKVGNDIDISIPRRERAKAGLNHKDFDVFTDPTMSPIEAAARRDFTINSMAMEIDGQLIDPYGGTQDIKNKLLRATSEAFKEDPLRVLRGMQFASRFGFTMESTTTLWCRAIHQQQDTLSAERIFGEWYKWAVKGRFPSDGLRLLADTCWINNFPALSSLFRLAQDSIWHPEGCVWTHTLHACDAAVDIANRRGFTQEQRAALMFAALLHDVGKARTTQQNEHGRITSPDHAYVGAPIARDFLITMKAPIALTDVVGNLVAEHMAHIGVLKSQSERPATRNVRRLAMRLNPATISLWAAVVESDHSGRPPLPKGNPADTWERVAEELQLQESRPKPILMGRHLIERGWTPGIDMGKKLKEAFEVQLDGLFDDLEGALKWLSES